VSASELIDSLRFRRFAEVQVGYELLADTPTTHDLHWRARKVGA
jgi:hypothetical protein